MPVTGPIEQLFLGKALQYEIFPQSHNVATLCQRLLDIVCSLLTLLDSASEISG